MIHVIIPGEVSTHLHDMMESAVEGGAYQVHKTSKDLPDLQNCSLLFVVQLDEIGTNIPLLEMLTTLKRRGDDSLLGAQAALIISSDTEYYTRSMTKTILFLANQMGCRFMGHPLVEVIGGFQNFMTWQKALDLSLEEIALERAKSLGKRLLNYQPQIIKRPKIVALHSSNRRTSNTLILWDLVKNHLDVCDIQEFHVENGTVLDCIGCPYQTCKHYGMQTSCFYGGMMVTEIYPAIEAADAIVWICPNYNNSVSANLIAVINRLTALYRKIKFYDKSIFALVVSANSGGDSVSKQLFDSLNINKGFQLPPYFALTAIANDPGSIFWNPQIEEKAEVFAHNMLKEIKA
ncbi:NADPH-dependent FMN reductase [Alkaliphilus metalliredigens QYMF]|uniref:NADPH-dependent FMN reductase n=1 Tax=Alkaliphilus metalliredigens (strain QYMF) TaxID=293826 RepID=A6TNS8_ALKMQ|nr:NAD(P)H-dependent oxidoreductase [Alkaliphilus metalliredigens]ABR47846.1 NADPH-dependent FMN reductase [Alkaliphilus metalliredigens QYMF]